MINIMRATFIKNYQSVRRAYPWSFMLERILIGFYTVLFSFFLYKYLFKGNVDEQFLLYTGSVDYLTYMVLGAAVYTVAVSTLMNVGRSLMNELREGTLETILLAPANRSGYLLGTFFEQFFRSCVEFATVIIVGMVLGADFTYVSIFDFIIVFCVSTLSFFLMGIALASLMLFLRDTYITQNTLFFIMNFISGVSFPVEYLPRSLQFIAHFSPLTSSLKLFRHLALGGSISANINSLIETIILGLVYGTAGLYLLPKIERRLLEKNYI
ncbi:MULTISPECIES: ABC transporter permease [unclassified Paenibacillus]|uniref:ABC transporter permease n=1 Tax=unclassified Paenibacillus TaxID=185978 RepID=UPI0024066E71|nr:MULTISPECIES: ABC transporter permease [unclassified Paenibacillus]MDF9844155.1 ABC-2 type transport system permease protein [Paenibacillus sp. PastF-2]MDF9850722.1 ABC-2 type transport system permease protein [Paenibacillus sp. PastM-2]MDF9857293.1 ABC-2 type transport system permease protein [Paenibacillus sp. PastF-1]MDH6482599.1 ABC-2 type transport system permease protein [Paenibacillus sp. PastH-2]MDH6510026.1 ABC-2 type transport system permease protein [Paenibacillus sp. PastM-3]